MYCFVLHTSLPDNHRELEPPDPIPNSVVKWFIADGSVGFPHVRVGHCQASKLKTPSIERFWGFFCLAIILVNLRLSASRVTSCPKNKMPQYLLISGHLCLPDSNSTFPLPALSIGNRHGCIKAPAHEYGCENARHIRHNAR